MRPSYFLIPLPGTRKVHRPNGINGCPHQNTECVFETLFVMSKFWKRRPLINNQFPWDLIRCKFEVWYLINSASGNLRVLEIRRHVPVLRAQTARGCARNYVGISRPCHVRNRHGLFAIGQTSISCIKRTI